MPLLYALMYWLVGFGAALAARFFLEYGTSIPNGLKHEPITWGGVIGCAFAGLIAPLTVVAAVVWGINCLCSVTNARGRRNGQTNWLNRPVLRARAGDR